MRGAMVGVGFKAQRLANNLLRGLARKQVTRAALDPRPRLRSRSR